MRETQNANLWPEIFAYISNVKIGETRVEVCPGLTMTSIYTHYHVTGLIITKARISKSRPHPKPWLPLYEDEDHDCFIEVKLSQTDGTISTVGVAAIRLLTSLIRLIADADIAACFIADRSVHDKRLNVKNLKAVSVEGRLRRSFYHKDPLMMLESPKVMWLTNNFLKADFLAQSDRFENALNVFDTAQFQNSRISVKVLIWTSLEVLFDPPRNNMTKNLARAIAAFLCESQFEMQKLYQALVSLALARGGAVHAAHEPDIKDVYEIWSIARQCFIKTIEKGELPIFDDLKKMWSKSMLQR